MNKKKPFDKIHIINNFTKDDVLYFNKIKEYYCLSSRNNIIRKLLKIDINIKDYQLNKKRINNFDKYNNKEFIESNFLSNNKQIKYKQFEDFFNVKGNVIPRHFEKLNIFFKKYMNHTHIQNKKQLKDSELIKDKFITDEGLFDIEECMEYFNIKSKATAYKKIKDLGINYKKNSGKSQIEIKIKKFLESNSMSILHRDRTLIGSELDLVDPLFKFAIEFNGLMFHSFGFSKYSMFNNPKENKKQHLNKTEECEKKDYQLFHIFENEWVDTNKQKIWKSILNDKINKNSRIFARKCIVEEIPNNLKNHFLDNNHLQGSKVSSINLGLFYNHELVAVATFSKHPKYQYELIRFCNKINYSVVGGASKLIKYFERLYKPTSLVSYANRRWSKGNLYKSIGFIYKGTTSPNYFYFHPRKQYELYSRVSFQKHKLKDKLEKFNPELTETENMYNNGYRKIYDSGNHVFIKQYKKERNE